MPMETMDTPAAGAQQTEQVPSNTKMPNHSVGEVDEWEPPFPNEVWDHVLENLSAKDLLPVRLVCRRFKDLVDNNPRTRAKFFICFPMHIRVDESYKPENLLPAGTVIFQYSTISAVNSWWPSLAERLFEICLDCCSIAPPILTVMLRQTINLNRLTLTHAEHAREMVEESVDFELTKLEKLVLICVSNSGVLSLLEQTCKRLKDVRFHMCKVDSVPRIIQASQNTLESVSFSDSGPLPNSICKISQLKQLHLKRASFIWHAIDRNELCEFGYAQPTLEDLEIVAVEKPYISQTFGIISQHFSNLKRCNITVDTTREELPSFFMIKLEHLIVNYKFGKEYDPTNPDSGWPYDDDSDDDDDPHRVELANCSSPNLKSLKIVINKRYSVSLKNFSHLLDTCPNLGSLHLSQCHISKWSDIFNQNRLKSLRSLELLNVSASERGPLEQLNDLRYLKIAITDRFGSEHFRLKEIIGTSNQLEELILWGEDYHTDIYTALQMSERLMRLKKLRITNYSLEDADIKKMKEAYRTVDHVEISKYY